MKNTTVLLSVMAGLLAGASAASAADLAARAYTKAPAAVVSPAYDWSGFYIGVDAGGIWGDGHTQNVGAAILDAYPKPSGFSGGGHIGYLKQFSNFVLGIEGDASGLSADAIAPYSQNFGASATLHLKWNASVRAIGGVAFNDNLLYATGGASWINYNGCETGFGVSTCFTGIPIQSATANGWTVGAGFAHTLTPNLSLRAEYLYADYGTQNLASPGFGNGTTSYHLTTNTGRIGLSYKFGGPVVAKY